MSRPTILVGFFIGDKMARVVKRPTKSPSVRDKAAASRTKSGTTHKLRSTAASALKPLGKVVQAGKKEVYLPLPKNKVGNFLNKRRFVIPRYFRDSWNELKEVTWPNSKQTIALTIAVFIFAIILAIFVSGVDFGLDKLFRKVLLS